MATLLAAGTVQRAAVASSQDLQQAKASLASLNARLSLLAQQYDLARLKLRQTGSQEAAAQVQAARAQAEFASATADLNSRARMAYETGGASNFVAVLSLGSVQEASAGVQYLATIAQDDADAAIRAQVSKLQETAAAERLRFLAATQQRLVDELATQRAQISSAIASQVALIRRIERQVHHAVVPAPTDTSGSGSGGGTGGGSGGGGGTPPPPPPGQIDALIYSIWGTGTQGKTAGCIADRESGDNPYARSPSGAAGLFQLMPFWWDGANAYGWKFDPYDANANATHAHMIWKKEGWAPWGGGC